MTQKRKEIYADYFKFRDVDTDSYRDFTLPTYLRRVLPENRQARILDIGCGLGQMLKALRSSGYCNASGIDISPSAVVSCKEQGLYVEQIDSISGYRPSGGRFDFIIMSHVIEHLEKAEIIETLGAIRLNLLHPGGALVIMAPNAQSHTGCYWVYEDFTHCTLFTAGSLSFVLKSAGFAEVRFLDPLGTTDSSRLGRVVKHALMFLYRKNLAFWNFITASSFHQPSPQIFTFELKALAQVSSADPTLSEEAT